MTSLALQDMLSDFRKEDLNRILISLKGETKSGNKDRLIEEVSNAAPPEKLEQTLSRAECIAPYKHSWLFVLGRGKPEAQSTDKLRIWSTHLFPELDKRLVDLDNESNELQPTTQILDEARNRLYIKFTQWVKVRVQEQIDENTFRFVWKNVRHPVVVLLRGDLGIGEVRFNGFSQGRAIKQEQRVPYSTIAIKARELIKERLNTEMRGLPCMEAASLLLKELPTELRHLGSSSRRSEGMISLRSDDSTPEGDIADLLANELNIKAISQIREALRSMTADSILIEWKRRGTLTRISNEMGYTEILFFWRGERTNVVVDEVISHLVKAHAAVKPSNHKGGVREFIEKMTPGHNFLLSEIINQFQEDIDWIRPIIEDGIKRGIIERQFRVRTDKILDDFRNDWFTSITNLPSLVIDEEGHEISLRDPGNIEVGYRRK